MPKDTAAKLGKLPVKEGYVRCPRKYNDSNSYQSSRAQVGNKQQDETVRNLIHYEGVKELSRINTRTQPH